MGCVKRETPCRVIISAFERRVNAAPREQTKNGRPLRRETVGSNLVGACYSVSYSDLRAPHVVFWVATSHEHEPSGLMIMVPPIGPI